METTPNENNKKRSRKNPEDMSTTTDGDIVELKGDRTKLKAKRRV